MAKVKLSILLSEPLHQELKLVAVKKRSSLQKIMEDAAEHALSNDGGDNPVLTESRPVSFSNRTIQLWQEKLKKILTSGDTQAIQMCTTCLDAMDALIKNKEARIAHNT